MSEYINKSALFNILSGHVTYTFSTWELAGFCSRNTHSNTHLNSQYVYNGRTGPHSPHFFALHDFYITTNFLKRPESNSEKRTDI